MIDLSIMIKSIKVTFSSNQKCTISPAFKVDENDTVYRKLEVIIFWIFKEAYK